MLMRIRPAVAFTLMLGLAALVTAARSSGRHTRYMPPVKSTEAKLPDPCRLVAPSTITDLVGKSTSTKTKGIHDSLECQWNSVHRADSGAAAILHVNTFVQREQVQSAAQYDEAKALYQNAKGGRPCSALRTSADEACRQQDNDRLELMLRKQYVVATLTYTAGNPPALRGKTAGATAQQLADEILTHIQS